MYLEVGSKRVFACSLEWPGWCRAGKDEAAALAALRDYGPRYAAVARRAKLKFPADPELGVVLRVKGSGTTDFGAPGEVAPPDRDKLSPRAVGRLQALLEAAWEILDGAVEKAPKTLRKGPRGGGRDRDPIVEHVLGAEVAYAGKLGLRLDQPAGTDRKAVLEQRRAILAALEQPPQESNVKNPWPPAYAARRIAWHVLDHAWEIEDRVKPASR